MASLDTLDITNSGLININEKIVNSRTYASNLITAVGNPVVANGIASGFSSENYFTYPNLSFNEPEQISITFKGNFIANSNKQCAFQLLDESGIPLICTFENERVTLTYGDYIIFTFGNLISLDRSEVSIFLVLKSTSFEFTMNYGKDVIQKSGVIETLIPLSSFKTLFLGNNFTDKNQAWYSSINLKEFSIYNNGALVYTPSVGASWNFSNILVSDGAVPLTDKTQPIAGHIFSFPVTNISQSGSTTLLTCEISEDSYLTIKEIGIYIQTPSGKLLFGFVTNLNINKEKDLAYDLIFTVNTTINVVNAIGFPAENGIIVKDPDFVEFKHYTTIQQVNTYVLTNLERIIRMNAGAKGSYENSAVINNQAGIGHNRPQVMYRLQRDLEQKEDCYNTIDTFTKLVNRFREITQKVVDSESFEVVGSLDIPEDGNISGFTNSSYIVAPTPFTSTKEWKMDLAFTGGENAEGPISKFIGDPGEYPLELGVENGKCYLKIKGASSIEPEHLNSIYARSTYSDTENNSTNYYAWKRQNAQEYFNFHLGNFAVSNSPNITFPTANPILWAYPSLNSDSFEITLKIKMNSITDIEYLIGKPADTQYVPFEMSVEQGRLKCSPYNAESGELISESLSCRYPFKTNKFYNITFSYQNGRYSLSYQMEAEEGEYPEEDSVFIYSDEQVTFEGNGHSAIGYTSTISPSPEFQGVMDLSKFMATDENISWTGASSLNNIFTTNTHPVSTDLLYDSQFYVINGEHPLNYATTVTLVDNNNLFTVKPENKYNLSITYSETGTTGTYKVEKITNENPYSKETILTKNVTVVNATDRMGVPSSTQIGPYINGIINLLDWNITQEEFAWDFYNTIIINNTELLQYYRLPDLNKNQYAMKDLCNLERKIRFLSNTFEGNEDIIDFSYANGLSLCMKVALTDAEPKVVLYKSDLVDNIYFSLTFLNQTLEFNLVTQSGKITLSRHLSIEEYASYTTEPIMVSIIFTPQYEGWGYIQMFKNNEAITEEIYAQMNHTVDPLMFILSNYIKDLPTYTVVENGKTIIKTAKADRYLKDLVVIKGVISTEDLKYINNLFDTNY